MKKPIYTLLLIFLTSFIALQVMAQRRDLIKSPEINGDGSVTFRYDGPKAASVEISAEFLKEKQKLIKGDTGVWSITIPSIEPDIYPYFFVVDGVNLADPSNAQSFPNELLKRSLVQIPAKTPQMYDVQDVPHGTLSSRLYKSKTYNLTRPLMVYTPPGYETNTSAKYPVLYLIHGRTDTQEAWDKVGKINLILDNLIAQGKAKPMIIVMPYTNAFQELQKKDKNIKVDFLATDMVSKDLTDDIIPFTESSYRVLPGAENRAIAGFSLGGRQTLAIGLSHPKTFSYVCAYAPAVWKRELDNNFKNLYAPSADLNSNLKVFWIGVGKTDFLYQPALDLTSALDAKKIKYTVHYSEGGHTWMNVRDYVEITVPMLFK